jgi:hypothetical protein
VFFLFALFFLPFAFPPPPEERANSKQQRAKNKEQTRQPTTHTLFDPAAIAFPLDSALKKPGFPALLHFSP